MFVWVPGHVGITDNSWADMAVNERLSLSGCLAMLALQTTHGQIWLLMRDCVCLGAWPCWHYRQLMGRSGC